MYEEDLKANPEECVPEPCINAGVYYTNPKDHEIRLRILNKGVVLEIGCKAFAFDSHTEALKELSLWLDTPKEAVSKYKEYLK